VTSAVRALLDKMRVAYAETPDGGSARLGRHVIGKVALGAFCEMLADALQSDAANDYIAKVALDDVIEAARHDRSFRHSPPLVIAADVVPVVE
jgi:hypothetical protein